MKLKTVLSFAALYLGIVGFGMIFVPQHFGVGAVPADASPELIAFLRIFGGPCLGIAVLNWLVRGAGPSATRDAVVLGNIVGFGCVSASDLFDVGSGNSRELGKLFLAIHLLMTAALVTAYARSKREFV